MAAVDSRRSAGGGAACIQSWTSGNRARRRRYRLSQGAPCRTPRLLTHLAQRLDDDYPSAARHRGSRAGSGRCAGPGSEDSPASSDISRCSRWRDAFRRISFARFSSRTSRSSAVSRSRSLVVKPGRCPASRCACRTHFRSVSAVQPSFGATDCSAAWTVKMEIPVTVPSGAGKSEIPGHSELVGHAKQEAPCGHPRQPSARI